VVLALTLGVLGLGLGGCAANGSRDWAQTAPVIAPSATGAPLVSLSAFEGE